MIARFARNKYKLQPLGLSVWKLRHPGLSILSL